MTDIIDGNGRMGRFWQTMLLSRWKGIFAWLPVETIVIGAQQYTRPNGEGKAEVFARSTSGRLLPTGRKNAIKHDFKSKNPTTRWSDIIRLK